MAIGKLSQLNRENIHALIEALLACQCMSRPQSLDLVIGELPAEIRSKVNRHPNSKQDVAEVVHACLQFSRGVEDLLGVVHFYEGDSFHWQRLQQLVHDLEQLEPVVNQLHRRCNRNPQIDKFVEDLRQHRQKRPQRPFLCLIHGSGQDRHDDFLDRLRYEVLPPRLALPANFVPWTPPPKPQAVEDRFWANFEERWLKSEAISPQESCRRVEERLVKENKPLLVQIQWYGGDFSREPTNGFLDFWKNWPDSPADCLVICLLSLVSVKAKTAFFRRLFWSKSPADRISEWMAKLSGPEEKITLSRLPGLDLVGLEEALHWCDDPDVKQIRDVKSEVIAYYAGRQNRPVDMDTLAKVLKHLLAGKRLPA